MAKAAQLKALAEKVTGSTVTGMTVWQVLTDFTSKAALVVFAGKEQSLTSGQKTQALGNIGAQAALSGATGYDATKTQALKQVSGALAWYDGLPADLAAISGYDAAATQTLKHESGSFKWVTDA